MTITRRGNNAFVLTVPGALRAFMAPHIRAICAINDVTVYSNFAADDCANLFADCPPGTVTLVHVGFERKIRLMTDLKTWWHLFRALRRGQHDSVHSLMPKTGLIAMTAGLAARTPIRIHMFTGQVWATMSGWRRSIMKMFDRLIAVSATHLLADSPSQRDFLIGNHIARNINVIGAGSVCGVDLKRFAPDLEDKARLRAKFGMDSSHILFGFLGRLNRDKGLLDLAEAFAFAKLPSTCRLMLVGPDEDLIADAIHHIHGDMAGKLIVVGLTSEPDRFVNMFDLFCLPSYREGFGTSIIEAAACAVPAIASDIYGLTDAVQNGTTGLLHEPRNVGEIIILLERTAKDAALRAQLGQAARHRVERYFGQEHLIKAMLEYYASIGLTAQITNQTSL